MLKSYLRRILEIANRGDAREESFYSSLEGLFKTYAESVSKSKVHITTLPKKTDAGNPDFRIWGGQQNIVGYIEAKKPTESNLDLIESGEQLKRYLHTFPNLILTNFLEFRLYRDGQLIDKVQVARPFVVHKLKTVPPVEKEAEFLSLLEKFFAFLLPKSYSAKTLAIELAKRTRFLKDEVIAEELKEESERGRGHILGFYEAFKKHLISGLTMDDFADLYAQTIAYGLFAARTRSQNGFNRKLAYDNIPPTIGILRDVFQFISMGDLPQQMEWIVDDISEVLAAADVNQILHKYYQEGKGKDPIIHFYETFLTEYDPAERERRGVYYTPEPVVSYITRSLHVILKEYFNRTDGFATHSVTVLDPAAGTLTFLADASKLAVAEFIEKYGEGGKTDLIKDHILKNFYAFELMMAPYAVGHLKMSFLLEELGFRLRKEDRFKLYLTNTLEMEELAESKLPGMSSLAEESHLAGKVKKETPILVVLGNPPYSGHSANVPWKIIEELDKAKKRIVRRRVKTFIGELIEDYKRVDGKSLGERNPKWLQDDYVKFIRFAQWKIDQAGEGVLGFITNHSYLDNPTFRGMRQSLMNNFDHIYLLDLHGNSLKKEKCPDGSEDKNVFDIQQGVAIGLFIKKTDLKKKIVHSERWGLREKKYEWLFKNDLNTTKWKPIKPKTPFYFFVPRDEATLDQYDQYPKVTEIFPINSVGIVTARDHLTIKWTPQEVWTTVLNFSKLDVEMARQAYDLGKDATDWKVELAQKDLKDSGLDKKRIAPILYRPFDIRYTYYTGKSRGFQCRPRPEVMRHMMQENLGLITLRKGLPGYNYSWMFACKSFVSHGVFYNGNQSTEYLFPLYLYPDTDKKDLFSSAETQHKTPNINPDLVASLSKAYGKRPTPEEIFCYVYAVLYSNTYRTQYAEFLKTDFPRVPFTKSQKTFLEMYKCGKQLVELHLFKSHDLDPPTARFQGKGDNRVEKPRYSEKEKRVYINADQYFEGVGKEVWECQIGGYQVQDKWLKDRKKRILSLEDIQHYCRVATALKKTIGIQENIDSLYVRVEQQLLPLAIG
jgi:Type ISP C-terminal specificity domain/N-6 DNA Methylase